MDTPETPAWYSIDALLSSGVQPFDDWPLKELEALAASIGGGRRPLADPVKVASDGVLLDGHQRLQAMKMAGRTRIYASDVHVVAAANAKNALDWAVELNAARRHLSTEQKQQLAFRLNQKDGWPQTKIAAKMCVTQGRVSQWISAEKAALAADTDAEELDTTETDDETKGSSRPPGRPSLVYPPWHDRGSASKMLNKAKSEMETLVSVPFDSIDDNRKQGIAHWLAKIADATATMRRRLGGEPFTGPVTIDGEPTEDGGGDTMTTKKNPMRLPYVQVTSAGKRRLASYDWQDDCSWTGELSRRTS